MRTTLTLEDDVAAALKRRSEEGRKTFKRVVNEVLRAGLAALEAPYEAGSTYDLAPVDLGACHLAGVASVHDMLAFGEGEDYR